MQSVPKSVIFNQGCDQKGSDQLRDLGRRGCISLQPQFHLLARRGSLPLLMVTEDFAAVAGAETVTGGAPLPGERPLGLPTLPNAESRGAPGGWLANGGMAPLPVG